MRRRSSSISDNVLYPKTTMYMRVAQMILCLLCIILALYYWTLESTMLGATVVLFATSFGFLVITVIDMLAGLKRKQYTAPVWVGLAFLAAFMCFLSFGFMVLQTVILHIVIGITFAVTGIVFLVDGIIILVHMFELKLSKKVHPIPEEKQSIDQPIQVEDDLEIIEELPVEVKKYAQVAALPPKRTFSVKSSSRSSFPITSYGGTFPMGGSDAPPLPTPDKLTGMEPAIPAHIHVPKKNGQDSSPETRSISSDVTSNKNLYPAVTNESLFEESMQSKNNGSHAQSEPGVSQQVQSTTYSSSPTFKPQNYESTIDSSAKMKTQSRRPLPYQECVSTGVFRPPYPAIGKSQPNMTISDLPFEAMNQRDITPKSVQACQCCATRAHNINIYDNREQIAPFVTHQYNQSPCICGYTHYQASTVVKGAVKQHPQDSLQQQQMMIKEQLEQMRDNHMYHGCSCHDESTKETKVPYMHLGIQENNRRFHRKHLKRLPIFSVRGSPIFGIPENSKSMISSDYKINTEEGGKNSSNMNMNLLDYDSTSENEKGSNESLYGEVGNHLEISDNNMPRRLSSPIYWSKNLSDQDKSMNRKVTIGTLDIISPSGASQESNALKYRRWAENISLHRLSKDNQQRGEQEISSNPPRGPALKRQNEYALKEQHQTPSFPPLGAIIGKNPQESVENDSFDSKQRKTTAVKVNDSIVPPSYPRRTIVSRKGEADYLNRSREASNLEDPTLQYPQSFEYEPNNSNRRFSKLGGKNVLDSYSLLMENSKSTQVEPHSSATTGTSIVHHKNDQTFSSKPEDAPFYRRRTCNNESTQTTFRENLHCPCLSGFEIFFHDEEALQSSLASSPSEMMPEDICQGLPPKYKCCPSVINEAVRYSINSMRREEIRGPEEHSHPSMDEKYLRVSTGEQKEGALINNKTLENFPDSSVSTRISDPIQEQIIREEIHQSDSEAKIDNSPTYHDRFPTDMMMMKQMCCSCKCICHPKRESKDSKKAPECTVFSNTNRYDGVPLNLQPYHPKDNFRMSQNPFTVISGRSERSKNAVTPRRNSLNAENSPENVHEYEYQHLRSPQVGTQTMQNSSHGKSSLECLEKCLDCSVRIDKPVRECLEECSSCPIRRRRVAREAELMEELNQANRFRYFTGNKEPQYCISRRGSLKRSHPEERK